MIIKGMFDYKMEYKIFMAQWLNINITWITLIIEEFVHYVHKIELLENWILTSLKSVNMVEWINFIENNYSTSFFVSYICIHV